MLHQVDQFSGRRDAKQVLLSSCQEKKTARVREMPRWLAGVETPIVLCNYWVVTFISLAYRVPAIAETGWECQEQNGL